MGYATGQFGKNHLGDLNEYLPTVHGFDEFFGYLYHLDAMEDPAFHSYPPELKAKVGPRNMIHSRATEADDPTEQPRWGKVGKQKIEDAGTLYPGRMKTVDDEILARTFEFIDRARGDGKPFFAWLNPTRMHVITHLSEKYAKTQTPGRVRIPLQSIALPIYPVLKSQPPDWPAGYVAGGAPWTTSLGSAA